MKIIIAALILGFSAGVFFSKVMIMHMVDTYTPTMCDYCHLRAEKQEKNRYKCSGKR